MDNPAEIVSLINSIFSTTIPLLMAFFWLLVFFVKYKSLRTLFFWERLIGKGVFFKDKCFQNAWDNQKELQQLSAVLPAIKYKNIYHAKNMQDWMENNKIGDSELAGLDDFFIYNSDYSAIKLKKAKMPLIFAAVLAFMCFSLLSLALFSISFKSTIADAAIGELKVNHETVWVYKDKVEGFSLGGKSWSVTSAEINEENLLTEDAIKSIRNSISSGDVKTFYEKNKVGTVVLSGFFFVVLLYFSILLARFIVKADRVSKLFDRVEYIRAQAGNNHIKDKDEVYEGEERDACSDANKCN